MSLSLGREQGAATIGSVEPELAEALRTAGLITSDGEGFRIEPPADRSLHRLAHWLRERRLCAPWRDELLDVPDASGAAVARVERAVVRVLGIRTRAVHLVGVGGDGDAVWAQQRAFDKSSDPGQWDTLMGGQVAAGESVATTLARETLEEAGLEIGALREMQRVAPLAIRRPVAEGYMIEDIDVFRAIVPAGVEPVNRDGEVERFELLGERALRARLEAGQFTLEATLILGAELARRG